MDNDIKRKLEEADRLLDSLKEGNIFKSSVKANLKNSHRTDLNFLDQTIPFFEILFKNCKRGYLKIRPFDCAAYIFLSLSKLEDLKKGIEKFETRFPAEWSFETNSYDGAFPNSTPSFFPAFWVDLDIDVCVDDINETIDQFQIEPSIIVQTNPGRYHLYWILKEPLFVKDNFPLIFDTQIKLRKLFGGDMNSCNIPGLGRVVGTWNRDHSPPYLVNFTSNKLEYVPGDFERIPCNLLVEKAYFLYMKYLSLFRPEYLNELVKKNNNRKLIEKKCS